MSNNLFIDFATAGISAAASKTIVTPMEKIKTLIGIHHRRGDLNIKSGIKYKALLESFKSSSEEFGPFFLWRGNYYKIRGYLPTQALNFALKDTYQLLFRPKKGEEASLLRKLGGNLLAGGFAGTTAMALVLPMDAVRSRIFQEYHFPRKELRYYISSILKSEGPSGFFRGLGISGLGAFVYRASYFGLYDTAKEFMGEQILANFGAAFAITTFSKIIGHPIDAVRRSMTMESLQSESQGPKFLASFAKIYKAEGLGGLFKPSLSINLNSFTQVLMLFTYDHLQVALRNARRGKAEDGEGGTK